MNQKTAAGLQLGFLLAALAAAGDASRATDWRPLPLVAVLLALAVAGDLLAVPAKALRVSGALLPLVLAMALLGPAPAVAIGVASTILDALRTRPRFVLLVNNLATYAVFPLVGAVLIRLASSELMVQRGAPAYALLVFGTFVAAIALNFLLVALHARLLLGTPLSDQFRTVFLPVLPSEMASAMLTVAVAAIYIRVGTVALALLSIVLFTFQYLLRELILSQERAEELGRRTTQLASAQVGMLDVMMQTLSLRDPMTARHSAAVARYSRELAASAGLSSEDQELVHLAGLLHDIGKFTFPDSLLLANGPLTEGDRAVIRGHVEQGARIVRRVEGHGPVAEIIEGHHERPDGGGYPRGLAGDEVPLLSRVISVADTYDVLTARDSYRTPVSPEAAVVELRRVAGTQLDPALVEAFVHLLEGKELAFRHADDADFEAELAFERRVRVHAWPGARAPALSAL